MNNSWQETDIKPDHFVVELYDQDLSKESMYQKVKAEIEEEDVDIAEDEEDDERQSTLPMAPLYPPSESSNLLKPLPFSMKSSRDRSRSPLGQVNKSEALSAVNNILLDFYEEEGMQRDVPVSDEFLTPDTHEVYVKPEYNLNENCESKSSATCRTAEGVRVRNVRGRRRLARGQRGGSWTAGEPLQFIYLNDADVPPELANMTMDMMKSREERVANRRRTVRSARETDGQNEKIDCDGFFDAADERGNTILGEDQLHFDWFSMESFRGEEEVFQPQRTGSVRPVDSAYEAFRSYWDDHILQHIVDQTNRYATRISSAVFQSDWYPTNAHEILCLFAFWMMLGIVRMPTIKSCFSMDPLLKTEVFRRIFSQKRYVNLTRALHFVDGDPSVDAFPSSDRLHYLRPILDHLNSKFQENYILSKDICIDKSLTLWKGRLNFKQYIRSKVNSFGIKTFELCESATGYLWSFFVDTGKQRSLDSSNSSKSAAVVMKLICPLLNKGYRLFMDNWYNSPALARYLKVNRTDCVGTLRPTCQDLPVLLREVPLKQGQYMARHSGDVCVLAWQDKKRITMLSTCHGAQTALPQVLAKQSPRPQQFKPQMVLDYNKSMGGVNIKDHLLEPYLLERKRCAKWYMKLFKHLLNCSILNARILLQSSSNTNQDNLVFRLKLVDAILGNHLSFCPSNRRQSSSTIPSSSHLVSHAHWPVYMEQSQYDAQRNRQNRKRCFVCLREGRKLQKTAYMCDTCKVPLCVVNCFKSFHSS